MTRVRQLIIGGVYTHAATHHAAVIDLNGRLLDDAEFAASPAGYAQVLSWMRTADRCSLSGSSAQECTAPGSPDTCTNTVSRSWRRPSGPATAPSARGK